MLQHLIKNSLFLGLVLALGCGGGNDSSSGSSSGSTMAAMPSNFGTITLAPGFMPDPSTAEGTSAGTVDASTMNPECRGWVGNQPDHVFVASSAFTNLRIMAAANTSGDDITMVIQKPDGTFLCDDDGGDALDPMITGAMPAGTYKIYVGSYGQGQRIAYKLGITEMMTVTTDTVRGGGAAANMAATPTPTPSTPTGASNFDNITVAPGFMPDPMVVTGVSGGARDASTLNPECRGWIAGTPDHLLVTSGNFNNLRVMVRADDGTSDTTLVIQKPDGSYLCNDDGEGMNPLVSGPMPAGTYQVWVGSYMQGQNFNYHIGVSELASVTPNSLAGR